MDNRPIGIFDSGVGGLSAAAELTRLAPNESFVYFGDTLRAPYGDRTPEEIKAFSRRNARFLRSQDIKALIVACNTSTANAMAELSADNADIPVVGTIAPTSRTAAKASAGGNIGVLATGAVVRRGSYEKTILETLPGAHVTQIACPKLVPLIESGHTEKDDPALIAALEEYLAPMKAAGVDTLVLGCTHYPLVRGAVLAVMERQLPLIDSGGACAGAILSALSGKNALAAPLHTRREVYYCSAGKAAFTSVAQGFLGRSIACLTEELDVEGY